MIRIFLFLIMTGSAFGVPIRGGSRTEAETDTLAHLILTREGESIRLQWNRQATIEEWYVVRSQLLDFAAGDTVAISSDTTWVDSLALQRIGEYLYWVIARTDSAPPPDTARVILDFNGDVVFESYDNQDDDPDDWSLLPDGARDSIGCLRMYGDTWKTIAVARRLIDRNAVWELSFFIESRAEMQAIGVADSANEFWYALNGKETRYSLEWYTNYQSWFPDSEWVTIRAHLGDDWVGRFGYVPAISSILVANDNDTTNPAAAWRIDDIIDITGVLPESVTANFSWAEVEPGTIDSFDVDFMPFPPPASHPDWSYAWEFGDGARSTAIQPRHRFARNGSFSVALMAYGPGDLFDWKARLVSDQASPTAGTIRAVFTGDVMMARRYEDPGGIIETRGVNAIFENVTEFLSPYDLAACNLECPLTDYPEHHPTKSYYFKGRPEYVSALTFAGFDYCDLANNHNFDYLAPGMVETEAVLDSVGILSSGSGLNDALASRAGIFSRNGLNVAILGFCNVDGTFENAQPFMGAGPEKPGFAFWDRTHIETEIPAAAQRADVVVTYVHSGLEYDDTPEWVGASGVDDERPASLDELLPDTNDIELRHYAVDVGADLVINAHPHVLQGIECYNDAFIAHSMGNFAFDQRFPETFISMALATTLDSADGARDLIVHPIYIDRYVPIVASGELGRAILDHVSELSRPLGTWVFRTTNGDSAIVLPENSAFLTYEVFFDTLALADDQGFSISPPLLMRGLGYPVDIELLSPATGELRAGAEILCHGNMEAEGATPWSFDNSGENYDSLIFCRGARSLVSHQSNGSLNPRLTRLMYHPPIRPNREHSLIADVRGDGATSVSVTARTYRSRDSGVEQNAVIGPFTDTFDWTHGWSDFVTTDNAYYYDVILTLLGLDDDATAWMDDVRLVQWENWGADFVTLAFPGDLRYVQIRTAEGQDTAIIRYRVATIQD